ncbi:MAG: hypothetical protein LUC91_05300, partial [Prevotella sp.]|nr:hypothetical protein [Prevotella sp.]
VRLFVPIYRPSLFQEYQLAQGSGERPPYRRMDKLEIYNRNEIASEMPDNTAWPVYHVKIALFMIIFSV